MTGDDSMSGRYPPDALKADGLRAGAGLALTLGPFLIAQPHPLIAAPLLAGAALFGVFALRTGQRRFQRIAVDATGIRQHGPLGRAIRWDQVETVGLSYYSTRRDRQGGWMQLTVRGAGRRIAVESTLDGFDRVAAAVAAAVRGRGLPVSEATRDNFVSLGHAVDPPRPSPFRP